MRYLGFIVERYGYDGWENPVLWVAEGYPDEHIIFRSESEAKKCLRRFMDEGNIKDDDGIQGYDYRISTTVELH